MLADDDGRSELGHVAGAWQTGGTVKRVVLHPLSISQTDVMPNPEPLVVVWLGPMVGVALPLLVWLFLPRSLPLLKSMAKFFAGFCLVANGAYIAFGAIDSVGDCGVMLENGSEIWQLVGFGAVAMIAGLYVWHTMGSIKRFFEAATIIEPLVAHVTLAVLLVLLAIELGISPR